MSGANASRRVTRSDAGPGDVEGLDAVPGAGERALDAGDGLGRVELGLFFGVGDAEVVRERDAHAR